ncbi:MAG TPA: DUF4245 domain-containing protein [Nocardioidaceae bacterium]
MSEQPGRYQRSAAGMVGAMVVLVLFVVAVVVLRGVLMEEPVNTVEPVDYRSTAERVQDQADFPLLAPASLPEGWRATSVGLTPDPTPRWHLGMLTDEDRYVGLEQARSSERRMVERYVDSEAVPGEPVDVDGDTWRTWTDEGGDTALSRVEDGVTTVVVGTPGQDVLIDFVRTLR